LRPFLNGLEQLFLIDGRVAQKLIGGCPKVAFAISFLSFDSEMNGSGWVTLFPESCP
jgi:hypothetical protein